MAKRSTRKLQTIGLLADPEAPLRSRPGKSRNRDQPRLPFDPMPQRIEPALALLARKVPKGDQWAFEIKWDGYRLAVHVEPSGVRIINRGGHGWTPFFPAIAKAAKDLGPTTMILDGEAVVLDDKGLHRTLPRHIF
jgi:bifunctional non-homologous end joining protein LigD